MAKNGNSQKVYLVQAGIGGSADTYTAIVGETNNSIDINAGLIDASDKTTEWGQNIPGMKSWSASVDCNLDNSATGKQKDFLTGLIAGTKVKVFIGELNNSSAPSEGYTGEAYVESVSETRQNGSIISRTISLKGDGELTPTWPA